jgi:GNAT acetyltransferase-like protein
MNDSGAIPVMQKHEKVEIKVARSLAEVEALREAWTKWPSHRDSDIDFYLMIIQSYPEVLRPHVMALYRDGELDAIMVGRLEEKKLAFNIGYLRPFRPLARCLTFVYGAVHGNNSPENTQVLVEAVMDSLKLGEADLAMLEFVPVNSRLYQQATNVPRISRDTLQAGQGHDVMIVPESIDEVYRRMSSDRRIETRRRVRKLQSHPAGKPKIACYRHESELGTLFHDAEEIAKTTYHRGLGVGFADKPDVRARLELAAKKGWLRANLLYIGERPVAFWIGMLYHGSFISEYMGYDPEFRRFSPGMVLIMSVIEGFCSRANGDAVKDLDFGLGHAEYKGALCSESWMEAPVYIFSPTLRGFKLKAMRSATRVIDRGARKILTSSNFLPRLKRAWRDRLARKAKPQADFNKSDNATVVLSAIPPEAGD